LNCKMVHRTSVWNVFEVLWGNKTSKTLNPKHYWWEICNNFFYKYTFRCCYALEDLHLFLGAISWPFSLESNISWKVCSKHWFWKISRLVFWDHLYSCNECCLHVTMSTLCVHALLVVQLFKNVKSKQWVVLDMLHQN